MHIGLEEKQQNDAARCSNKENGEDEHNKTMEETIRAFETN